MWGNRKTSLLASNTCCASHNSFIRPFAALTPTNMIAGNTDWPGQLSWRYLSLPLSLFLYARAYTHTDLNNSGRHPQNSMPFHQLRFWSIPPLPQALPRLSPGSWALVRNQLLKLEILPFLKKKTTTELVLFSPTPPPRRKTETFTCQSFELKVNLLHSNLQAICLHSTCYEFDIWKH